MSDEDQTKPEKNAVDNSTEAGRMLARTWAIASNYRTPSDYGIPPAPTFTAERRADGTLVLLACPNSTEPVMTAEHSVKIRR